MSEPPTMIIWDPDEERTLVDRARLPRPDTALLGSGDASPLTHSSVSGESSREKTKTKWPTPSALLASYKRQLVESIAAVTVLLGLGSLAHQQSKVAEAMRETLAQLQAPRGALLRTRPEELPQTHRTRDRGGVERRGLASEIAADERDELERKAAALVASNDFQAALSQYETLAELFAGEQTFRDVVMVLRAKLRCSRSAESASGTCP